MGDTDVREVVDPLLERGECVIWMGRSSKTAHLPGHIPAMLFAGIFALSTCWSPMRSILEGRIEQVSIPGSVFLLLGMTALVALVRTIRRDMAVAWVVTDRRAHRVAGKRVITTDLGYAVAIEMRPREDGRGDVIVTLPQIRDAEGDLRNPSIEMLDVDDVKGARAAVAHAIAKGVSRSPVLES